MTDCKMKLSPGAAEHIEALKKLHETPQQPGLLSGYYTRLLARRYNLLIGEEDSVLELGCGSGQLLTFLKGQRKTGVDISSVRVAEGRALHPDLDLRQATAETLELPDKPFDVIVLSDVLNHAGDVELILRQLHNIAHPGTRLLINVHNTLWRPLLSLGRSLHLARSQPQSNWLSRSDVVNLCALADWEVFKWFGHVLLPLPIPWIADFINRWVAPLTPWLCLTVFLVARPVPKERRNVRKVSVVVPARNEAGSIGDLVTRVPRLGAETELIVIEGNSTDDTWSAIQQLPEMFEGGRIVKMRQTGKGKGNAVREAFAVASGDIVTILDADLTMPPEDLPKYVEALASGKAEFANGVRLVYPMDDRAMQFANLCANKAFSLLFSWLLGQPVKDTLCGTKAMWRHDYLKLDKNRAFFGDFDPFGDFDLLFGASKLNLKIMDVPIRYRERTYGETNIQRWRHGMILAGMVLFAARRLKFVLG
jgi:ubiquinone/menaquinone biosynthesis C-methylase UbiE